MSKGLTDIAGIRVGHVSDFHGLTGCTVILCERGAVAGVDVRGSASGSQEFEVLNPLHVTPQVHAVTFAGGSAYGLEAASGVRRYLEKKKVGFPAGAAVVPLVPCAILYDLAIGSASARPTREMGEAAAAAAHEGAVEEGCIGAGTGATVGKVLGMRHAMKSGVGSATVWLDGDLAGVRVAALAVVNAWGDVRDPENGQLVAGARRSPDSEDLIDACAVLKRGGGSGFASTANTTLVAVATNAKLTKVQATKLAQFGSLGLARTIQPVWSLSDGDTVIALSLGDASAPLDSLGVAAAEAVSRAILRAVRTATSMGGVPGLAGRHK
ncbi:MAG: P1 family peptidase [Bryobacteraceae bacterium]|nr:P1 family peptidase [Bryobacteraceae bacterium]MDW8379119.1 P1 family peptidase [Bryobacterales bacterium]